MNKLSQLWRRLFFYLRRDRFDRELEEEMRFHLEMKAEENLAAGVSPEEARYAAQRQFGNQKRADHRRGAGEMPIPLQRSAALVIDHRRPSLGEGFQVFRVADAFSAVGRLKPNVSVTEAQADMNVVASNQARLYPEYNADLGISVTPLEIYVTGAHLRRALWLLLGAVTLVLLISCSNVASLFLARGFARQGEYAIRAALGAGRIALLRQLGVEAITIFLIAGALGAAMAVIVIKVLRALAPANIARLEDAGISLEVLVFALALSVITAMIFGMAPAWKILKNDPQEFLKQGGRTDAGPGRRRIRELLLSLECALLVILLVATGLLLRSFLKLQDVDLGFRPDHLLSVRIDLPPEKYGSGDSSLLFLREAIERIETLPGVESAAVGRAIIGDHIPNYNVLVEGHRGSRQESVAVVGEVHPSFWCNQQARHEMLAMAEASTGVTPIRGIVRLGSCGMRLGRCKRFFMALSYSRITG